jgi:hypothetical protein
VSLTSNQRRAEFYSEQNIECTEIILADAVRYGGEESLMVRWARSVQKLSPMGDIPKSESEAA